MKKTIKDYARAICQIYDLTNRPEGLRNVSGLNDWLVAECVTAMVRNGNLIKSGNRGPVVFKWNPAAEPPAVPLYKKIMQDVLARDRRSRHKEPVQEPVENQHPTERLCVCYYGNKFITANGDYFELDDIYAVVKDGENGDGHRALGVHRSKMCADFFSASLTSSEAAFVVERIRERLDASLNNDK